MAYHLSPASIAHAIKHLCKYGDTDVFPHLPELSFLKEREADVTKELTELNMYSPGGAFAVNRRANLAWTHF